MLFLPLTMGAPSSSWSPGFCGPSWGETGPEVFGRQPDPWAPEQPGLNWIQLFSLCGHHHKCFVCIISWQVHLPIRFLDLDWILAHRHRVSIMPSIFSESRWVYWRHLFKWLWKRLKKVSCIQFSLWTPVEVCSFFFFQRSQLVLFGELTLLRIRDTCFY